MRPVTAGEAPHTNAAEKMGEADRNIDSIAELQRSAFSSKRRPSFEESYGVIIRGAEARQGEKAQRVVPQNRHETGAFALSARTFHPCQITGPSGLFLEL